MKIIVITTTVRSNPRFAEMAACLAHNMQHTPKGVELEWVIVDEKMWDEEAGIASQKMVRELVADQFSVVHIAPRETEHRSTDHRRSDMGGGLNSARNDGLIASSGTIGDYVLFLDDCTLLTSHTLETAAELAEAGLGYRVPQDSVQDHVLAADGSFKHRDHWDVLTKVRPSVVASLCWGVPFEAMLNVHGFDEAYDAELKDTAVEAIYRIARTGVEWVTTKRAFCVLMRRTHSADEVSTNAAVFRGKDNAQRILELLREQDRVWPEQLGPMFAEDLLADTSAPAEDPAPVPNIPGNNFSTISEERPATANDAEPEAAPAPLPLPGVADQFDDEVEQPVTPAAVDVDEEEDGE